MKKILLQIVTCENLINVVTLQNMPVFFYVYLNNTGFLNSFKTRLLIVLGFSNLSDYHYISDK